MRVPCPAVFTATTTRNTTWLFVADENLIEIIQISQFYQY